jgi:hypothetical protein
MKELNKLMPLSSFLVFVRRMNHMRTEQTGTNVVWRLLLGVHIVVFILVAIAAWFVYGSVIAEPSLLATFKSKDRQPAFSIEDLRGVITLYQKKEDDFALFHSMVPPAPELHKGSGVSEQPASEQVPEM